MPHKLFQDFFEEYLQIFPSAGSYLGYRKFDRSLENFMSRKTSDAWKKIVNKYIRLTRSFKDQDINIEAFKWYLNKEKKDFENITWMMPLSSYENEVVALVFFNKQFYPLKTRTDLVNLTNRYKSMTHLTYSAINSMKDGINRGVVLPQMIATLLLSDLRGFYKTGKYRIPFLFHVDEITRAKYENSVRLYGNSIKYLIKYIEKVYLPQCRETMGLCYLPSGKATYRNIVKRETTLDISPNEVFAYGLKEVERLLNEFHRLKVKLGYDEKTSFHTFCKNIMNNPNHYAKDVETLLQGFEDAKKKIRKTIMKRYFSKNVKTSYIISSVPSHMSDSSAGAFYYSGNYNEGRGHVFINTRDLKENPLYSTYVLSVHEGEPGHHYQFQRMIEEGVKPEYVFGFNANGFVEGWALYVESLGEYSDIEYFGKLCYEMLRAVRLVVDVGVHYYGWSWDHAFKYMKNHLPMKASEIKKELIRYICIPGQALSYKIGEKVFKELRDECLSSGGDLKTFHDIVLKNGVLPLTVLKSHVHKLYDVKQK